MHATPGRVEYTGRSRRDVLRVALLVGGASCLGIREAAHALDNSLKPTPANALGPFYPPIKPADTDADLSLVQGHSQRAAGTVLYVTGRVLDTTGRALPNAEIELWQANAAGRYAHPGDSDASGPLDPHFQGYARLVTGADGGYRIKTIKPAPYAGRTAHLHFNVATTRTRLTTQMFFAGDAANERDGLYRQLNRDERIASTGRPVDRAADMEPDSIANVWDIVLKVQA